MPDKRKRRAWEDDLDLESPCVTKRLKINSSPVRAPRTPAPRYRRKLRKARHPSRVPATPYTPFPPQPSESPSNPFRRRAKVDSLPPVTAFGKHIPLRFQFYRHGISFNRGGVHRVVQVPLNYTLVHLRAVIGWLFEVPAPHTNGKIGTEDYVFELRKNVKLDPKKYRIGMIDNGDTFARASNVRNPLMTRYGRGGDEGDELAEEESEAGDTEAEADEQQWVDENEYTLGHLWCTGLLSDKAIIYRHGQGTDNVAVHISLNLTKLPRRSGRSNVPFVFKARGKIQLVSSPLPRPLFASSNYSSSPAKQLSDDDEEEEEEEEADGYDTEEVQEGAFSENHPYFSSSSPPRMTLAERAKILAEDSDNDWDAPPRRPNEDVNKMYNEDQWNKSRYNFGRYLLTFLDPKGKLYQHLPDAYFEEKKAFDPFADTDEEDAPVPEHEDGQIPSKKHLRYTPEPDEFQSTPDLAFSSASRPSEASSPLPPSSPPGPGQHAYLSPLPTPNADVPEVMDPFSSSPAAIIATHYPNRRYDHTPAPPRAKKLRVPMKRLERRLEMVKQGSFLCANDEKEPAVGPSLKHLLDLEEEEDQIDQLAGDCGEDEDESEEVGTVVGDREEEVVMQDEEEEWHDEVIADDEDQEGMYEEEDEEDDGGVMWDEAEESPGHSQPQAARLGPVRVWGPHAKLVRPGGLRPSSYSVRMAQEDEYEEDYEEDL